MAKANIYAIAQGLKSKGATKTKETEKKETTAKSDIAFVPQSIKNIINKEPTASAPAPLSYAKQIPQNVLKTSVPVQKETVSDKGAAYPDGEKSSNNIIQNNYNLPSTEIKAYTPTKKGFIDKVKDSVYDFLFGKYGAFRGSEFEETVKKHQDLPQYHDAYSPKQLATVAEYKLKEQKKYGNIDTSELYDRLKENTVINKNSDLFNELKEQQYSWGSSPGKALGWNILAGVANIGGDIASAINGLGGNKIPGIKEITNAAIQGANYFEQKAARYNKGIVGQNAGVITQGVVNLLPYMILSTEKVAENVALNAPKYAEFVSSVIKNPSFWYSLTTQWGDKYQEALDNGANEQLAFANATNYAIPASLIEVAGGIGSVGSADKSLTRTIFEEIGEEWAQDVISGISDKSTTKPNLPVFSLEEDAIINPKDMAQTAFTTAAITAIGAGGGRAVQKIANIHTNNDVNNGEESKNEVVKYLTDNDYDDYIKSGNQHTQHKKADIVKSGESAILRSKEETDAFIERSLADSDFHSIRAFSKVTDRMAKDIANKGDVNVDGYYLELNSSDVLHASKHKNELRKHQTPLTENDLKRLPEYMVNYDDVLDVKNQKDGSVKVWLGKKINGHSIVITIVSKGRKSMALKSAYFLDTVKYDELFGTKKEEASHREATASNIDTTPVTSENVPSTIPSSDNNIPQSDSVVNTYDMQDTENNALKNELNFARENAVNGLEENENDSRKMKLAKRVMRTLNERYGINFKLYSGESFVNGFYENGTVYINEKGDRPILSILGHEFLHGFKDIDAEGYALLKSKTESDLSLKDYNRYKNALLNDYKQNGIDISILTEQELNNKVLEEAMSDMMGEIINDPETIRKIALEDKNLAERIMAYLGEFIDKIRSLFPENDTEIQSLVHNYDQIKAVYQEVIAQSDGKIDGNTVFGNETNFSVNKSFGKQVDDVLENKMERGYKAYLGTVSNLLAKCGFDPDLPLLMSQGHIRDIVHPKSSNNTRWHGIDKDIVKQIPALIKEPVMIYDSISDDSENTVCVVTNKKDSDGLPIIIAIKANSTDNVKFLDVEIHKTNSSNYVASMYGKDNFSNHLERIIENDALLFANKNKTQKLLSDSELQLLTRLSNFGFDKIIHPSRNIVKSENNPIDNNDMQNGKINASKVNLSIRRGSRAEKAQTALDIYEDTGNVADLPSRSWAREYDRASRNTQKMLENKIATAEWEKRYAKTDEQKARLDKVLEELRKQQEQNVANINISGELIGKIEGNVERNYNLADIIDDLKDIDKGLKIKSGNYRFNDFYRNFERVFGKHFDKIKPLLDNFDDAKGDASRYQVEKAMEEHSYITKELGIKKGSKESKAVQWIAEGERNPDVKNKADAEALRKMGVTDLKNLDPSIRVPYTESMLRGEFGNETAEKILKAEQWYREQYDEMINAINKTQRMIYPNRPEKLLPKRKDYMRHFREVKTGFDGLRDLLETNNQIAPGMVSVSENTSPKEKWASIKQVRKGRATSEGAIEGFNEYLGQAAYAIYINPYIEKFRGLARDLAELKSAGSAIGVNTTADENVSSLEKTPPTTQIRQIDNPDLNGFIEYLNDFANDLAGKTGGLDRAVIKSMGGAGRTTIKALQWFNNRTKSNAVLANIASMSKQIMNIPNGITMLQNPLNIFKGMMDTANGFIHQDNGINKLYRKSNFITERFADKVYSKFDKNSPYKFFANLLGLADEIGTRSIWNSLYHEAVKSGEADPIRYADVNTRKAVAGRGIGELPLAYKSQLAKLALPFQIEPTNSWNVIRDMVSGKTPKGKLPNYANIPFKTAVFMLVTWGMNAALESLTGGKGSFDPLGDIIEGIMQGFDEEEDESAFKKIGTGTKRAVQNIAGDFIGSRAFGWVVGELLDSVDEDWATTFFNDSLYQSQGVNIPALQSIAKAGKKAKDNDFVGAASELITSFGTSYGGKQLDKTIRGITDYARGGSYQSNIYNELSSGERGDLYYPIERTPGNLVKSAIFGPSSLKENEDYWYDKRLQGYKTEERKKEKEDKVDDFIRQYKKNNADSPTVKLYNATKSKSVFPYEPIEKSNEYTHKKVKYEYTLTDEQAEYYQKMQNDAMQKAYNKVFATTEYKYADNEMKKGLLSDARKDVKSDIRSTIKNDHIYKKGAFK